MTKLKKSTPDFFDEGGPDPVAAATGGRKGAAGASKKKAGFYLAADLLDRRSGRGAVDRDEGARHQEIAGRQAHRIGARPRGGVEDHQAAAVWRSPERDPL